jgi:16S rRNA (guanine966-N2)-methyltransferase
VRIVAGLWRGRTLVAPAGATTRPTADRVRQALFDMLLHAPWGGREAVEGAAVLDAFAGTGALGLEALSRGAAGAAFMETDRAALGALRRNVAACKAEAICNVLAADATRPPPGAPCGLLFLDPPYGQDLLPRAVAALGRAGWIAPGALIVGELSRGETLPAPGALLAERAHGAARVAVWRAA